MFSTVVMRSFTWGMTMNKDIWGGGWWGGEF
jgi:hypothetical protein